MRQQQKYINLSLQEVAKKRADLQNMEAKLSHNLELVKREHQQMQQFLDQQLGEAVKEDKVEQAAQLIEIGANFYGSRDQYGRKHIIAHLVRSKAMFSLLVSYNKKHDIDLSSSRDIEGNTFLHFINRNVEVLEEFLTQVSDTRRAELLEIEVRGARPIHSASPEGTAVLLRYGAKVGSLNEYLKIGEPMKGCWGVKDSLEKLNILLAAGVNLEIEETENCFPLEWAADDWGDETEAERDRTEALELLLPHYNKEKDSGELYDALIRAIMSTHLRCVELLLKHGADPNADYEHHLGSLADIIIEYTLNYYITGDYGDTLKAIEVVKHLFNYGIKVSADWVPKLVKQAQHNSSKATHGFVLKLMEISGDTEILKPLANILSFDKDALFEKLEMITLQSIAPHLTIGNSNAILDKQSYYEMMSAIHGEDDLEKLKALYPHPLDTPAGKNPLSAITEQQKVSIIAQKLLEEGEMVHSINYALSLGTLSKGQMSFLKECLAAREQFIKSNKGLESSSQEPVAISKRGADEDFEAPPAKVALHTGLETIEVESEAPIFDSLEGQFHSAEGGEALLHN
jgi:ankyrin repeat protein